jgi:3-hydroxyisobutyrate dehydrogenase and related beta-hydroxyacid dehydrogenases
MSRIAFIGLGRMGSGMAGRLLAAGHEVVVTNRTPERARPLRERGALWASTPAEAVADAQAVFAMLSDDEAYRAVWEGPDGVLAGRPEPGTFAVECSTLSSARVRELSAAVAAAGMRYLDCPVTGLPDAAAAGALTLLVGADDADLEAARGLLAPLANDLFHFGPVGAGTAYKLIVNLIGAVQIAGVAEGLAMAERAGLDPAQVATALALGQAASPQVVRNSQRMVAGDDEHNVAFSGRLRHKDTAYAIALADELGVDAPFGQVALDGLNQLLAQGLGERNESVIIEVARQRTSSA